MMKCDAKKISSPEGGFTCSVLGNTFGADWLWNDSPYKEKIQQSPECDACLFNKKTFWGTKSYFKCWVMNEFEIKANREQLETKIREYRQNEDSQSHE